MYIKIYHSFGSQHNAVINGHVFQASPIQFLKQKTWFWTNVNALIKMFRVKTLPHVELVAEVFGMRHETTSNDKGYFEFEFDPKDNIPAGWHAINVYYKKNPKVKSQGEIFVPYHSSQAIISDIDDTLLKSYSASWFRKIYELLSKNPHERKLFDHTVEWYRALAKAYPPGTEEHPFFYVSSSEWNLYDYLNTVFTHHGLPKGIFLLNHLKSLKNLFKTGKTGHDGKLTRINSLIKAFPDQKFILIGDNTQRDPYIYQEVAIQNPDKVLAIFIRNKSAKKKEAIQKVLNSIQNPEIVILQFDTTLEAMEKSKELGFIQ
ncbi:DUF2183 domain-containing protein [Flavobacteriaceae bacterium Ap0902]|nr:DUF2183 domain-containing protein [Flavobacteriaceae bacterium Ap0902]